MFDVERDAPVMRIERVLPRGHAGFSLCDRVRDEYANGEGQANRDVAKGEFKIAFVDGTIADTNAPAAFYEYTGLLRTRYRIGWVIYSLPDNPRAAEAWVRGYNEIAGPRVERQVGVQVLKETLSEAQKLRATAKTKH